MIYHSDTTLLAMEYPVLPPIGSIIGIAGKQYRFDYYEIIQPVLNGHILEFFPYPENDTGLPEEIKQPIYRYEAVAHLKLI